MASENRDPWLTRWLQLVRARTGRTPVLELGCGSGQDTATLLEAGLSVVALDLSSSAIERARIAAPEAEFHIQDLRAPFPASTMEVGVIVASLSLHYFTWAETAALVARIHATLRPGGILLCRLNSVKDLHFGAAGHPLIEENYYLVGDMKKRFFDLRAVEALFSSGWQVLSLGEHAIERYSKPKVVWEIVLERGG